MATKLFVDSGYDICKCGDFRHQHAGGTGRCLLGNLCTPSPCHKFRLCMTGAKYKQLHPGHWEWLQKLSGVAK